MQIGTLTADDCAAAGALVAARHSLERKRFRLLPAAYEDAARAADLVRGLQDFSEGVTAIDDRGDLAGS
jgi:hypothetical protein